jgi:hypothetical protein
VSVTPSGASVAVLDLGTAGPVRVYVGGLGSCTTVGFAGVAGLDPGVGTFSAEIIAFDEDTFAATGHRRMVEEALDRTGEAEFARTLGRWSSRGLHRTAVSLLAERPETFREQLGAFAGPRRYISGELTGEDLAPLREAGCDVRVVPAAGHALMDDNLDGFVAAIAA